ncbi:hypothetical protein BUL40_00685 [Croceivirga radicis]|uniref:Uncharacterized protein n=1 Tax=Croceivirga radicis TaxID=1929488 RepID=A0A1V6LV96_9FLAO|nr:hypothetical protein [Croceivirga radicis]OQD44104.1 hypothetical protein BUL40_00685 [Croceivirga radicis]
MNLAFSTILIFLILAPGFVFRISYNSTRLSVKKKDVTLINELTSSIIPSIIFQVIFLFLIEKLSNYYIDFQVLGNLILGNDDGKIITESFQNIRLNLAPIFYYNIGLFSLAYLLGHSARGIVRYFKWDRKYRFLRFSNKWFYILRGECLDFPYVPDTYEDISFQIVDVLCSIEGRRVIYMGEMFDYYIDGNGDLEAIHIRYPVRKEFDKNSVLNGTDTRQKEISSRFLIIPMKNIININIRYINLEEISIDDLDDNYKFEEVFDFDDEDVKSNTNKSVSLE